MLRRAAVLKRICDRRRAQNASYLNSYQKGAIFYQKHKLFYTTHYSVNNTILIAMQTGGQASMVAGYTAWQKNFGRQVNRGEKAIKIFAPMTYKRKKEVDMIDQATGQPLRNPDGSVRKEIIEVTVPSFRVTNVFDISQTSGPPLPTLVDELDGNVERYQDFVQAIRNISQVPVGFEEMEGKDGYYHQVEKRIAINENMSETQTMAAMIHELAHAKLHALDPNNLKESAKARGKDQRTMEVEALYPCFYNVDFLNYFP